LFEAYRKRIMKTLADVCRHITWFYFKAFFETHKNEEWMNLRYNPKSRLEYAKKRSAFVASRYNSFFEQHKVGNIVLL